MGVMFFVGIVVGWGITYWLLNRSWKQKMAGTKRAIAQRHQKELRQSQQRTEEWTKRSHHLQKTLQSSESTHQELTAQLEQRLQEQRETIHSLTQEKDNLLQQVDADNIAHQRTIEEWQQKAENTEIDYQSTIQKWQQKAKEWQQKAETAEEDAEKLLRELLQKEQDIKNLNHNLGMEVAHLNDKLRQLKYPQTDQESATTTDTTEVDESVDSHEQIISQIMEQIDEENLIESLSEVFTCFLPTVRLLRDSMEAIAHIYTDHYCQFASLISTLLHICHGEYQALRKYQKIHATNDEWSECRVPHINLLRLYFQKCTKEDGYQVLIAQKHDKKTQKRDFAWLNNQANC